MDFLLFEPTCNFIFTFICAHWVIPKRRETVTEKNQNGEKKCIFLKRQMLYELNELNYFLWLGLRLRWG